MKKLIIIIIIILLIAGGLFTYYNAPLSADSVIKYRNKIEKVYVSTYISKEGISDKIGLDISDPKKFSRILEIFDQVNFTHSKGSKNIKNGTRHLSLYIFYNKDGSMDDYTLEINEKGELLVDQNKYKIKNRASDFFEQLNSIIDSEREKKQ